MGITGFTEWFRTTFPFAITPINVAENAAEFDHILVDMNQFIHLHIRRAKNEEHLLIKVFSHLDKLFKLIWPRQSVLLALDGPASKAKFMEQRKRRKQKKKSSGKKEPTVDKLQITPGCAFMQKMKDALSFWACSRLQGRKWQNTRVYISGADVPGEGEIKVIQFIKSMREQNIHGPEDSYCIVGSDADMVLLGLSLKLPQISILTEHKKDGVAPSPTGKVPKIRSLLSVAALMEHFEEKFPSAIQENVAVDFVAMSMLMGNDYLPKFPGTSLAKLWIRYQHLRNQKQPRRYLIHENKIDMVFFMDLMVPFGSIQLRSPPINFVKAHARESAAAAPTDVLNVSLGDTDDDDDEDEAELLAAAAATTNVEETPAAPGDVAVHNADESDDIFADEIGPVTTEDLWAQYDPIDHVAEYIVGLETTIKTYLKGQCVDYNWFFPFSSSPTVKQLKLYAQERQRSKMLYKVKTDVITTSPRLEPLAPYKFCLMLLPSTAASYLPSAVAKLMEKDSALADMFHGPFKAYIDCDHVEKQIDLAIGSEPEKVFSEYERQYALFHPMFYYEFSYRGGAGSEFVPPPLPTPRTRPLNEPFRLRMGVLANDLTDPSPPAHHAASHQRGGNSNAHHHHQHQHQNSASSNTEKSTGNWRQREVQPNPDRYVPPHQRPGAQPKYRQVSDRSNYDNGNNSNNGYQQQQQQRGYQQGGGRQRRQQQQYQQAHEDDHAESTETPVVASASTTAPRVPPGHPNPAAQQFFPQMTQDQFLALQQQIAAMQAAAPLPQLPFVPPAMRPTEFGPDGLPIRHAQPSFKDPAIVSFSPYGAGASPYGAPFPPFAGALPPMMYPGMMSMPPNMMPPGGGGHPAAFHGQQPPQ
eukprot:TRINITY_DN3784_c0_g1_i2.p1 TRINITY_DN3784_c0_g1~~TRINITY_DN3784_c0_g1_i2.p1  ORF type:complete len:867 (+),score=192.87 TRINITY_DN3784_c0_g1_i2:104-2704(+)